MTRALRYSIRRLLRAPAFTATAVIILTLAVGATAAIFSLLYALVLRPLPVPAPEQLVQVSTRDRLGRVAELSWRQFRELLEHQRAFSTVIGSISQGTVTIETEHGALQASIAGVTGNYFPELGAVPPLGRLIQSSDVDLAAVKGKPVAVVGWSFWQRHYGGDPAVVGRSLRAEGEPLTIVGVAPPRFLGLGVTIEHDITIPLTLFPHLLDSEKTMVHGTSRWVGTTGRLARGVSLESARAQIAALWPALREAAMPPALSGAERDTYRELQIEVTSGARGVERGLRGRYSQPLYTLLAIAALILLIGAVNLGSLVFVRMESSRHELGIRLAIGAGRGRLIGESALQGVLLGVAGTIGALVFAAYASEAIAAVLLRDYLVPTALDVSPDARVVAIVVITSVGIGGVITAVAAWMVTAPGLMALMPGGNRSVARSPRTGKILVGVQATLAIVLLTHASLLGRNVYNLDAVDSGLTSDTVLIGSPSQRVGAYRDLDADVYYREALARVEAVPGVASAAFSQFRPERGTVPPDPVGRAGTRIGDGDVAAEVTRISPGFFETLGMSIVRGRDFTFADNAHGPRVAIVSRHLARRLFGEGEGLGERVRISTSPDMQDLQVVGIVNDARLFDVRRGNLSIAYVPALQSGRLAHFKFLIARAPASAAREIQQAIESLGAETMQRTQTLAYARGRTILQERLMAALGGYFGLLTLILVAAGVYGLLSYVLSLRRKEIGIRLALGADARRMGGTILGDGIRVAGAGLGVGLVAALASVRVLRAVLVATTPYDPIAIAAACGVLLAVTVLASVAPTVRAVRVDPLVELRRD